MQNIRLIHWNAEEAKERARRLQALGYQVKSDVPSGPLWLKQLRHDPPTAIVIDLSRMPMQGRDLALAARHSKITRNVPIVFVEGEPEKIKRTQHLLPDALFTSWKSITSVLKKAIAHPPKNPVVPESALAGYSGTPLVRKLGIKPEATVALVKAPPEFDELLNERPHGARIRHHERGACHLIIWFVRSCKDLALCIDKVAKRIDFQSIWSAWPKKASGISSDVSEQIVREAGLRSGLVDYKICAIDATWSGLKFARRKKAN